jgi:hypothetical protein
LTILEWDCPGTVDSIYSFFVRRQIIKGRSEDDDNNNEMERGGK